VNKKSTLLALNLIVLGLILLSVYGFGKLYLQKKVKNTEIITEQQTDEYSYLTTRDLKSLPPLPDTEKIVPTGRVKEFKLEAGETEWEVLPGVKTPALTYNKQSPGPVIRVTEGDVVRVTLHNGLQLPTSIHFHGMHLPNKQDGVPPLTQKQIEPGQSYTYEFIAGHAGTYMYHPHINSVEQIDQGLYGAFVIDPQNNSGYPKYDKEYTMVLAGWNITSDMAGDHGNTEAMAMNYNYWTINGKAYPATEKIKVKKGERVRIRFVNISNLAHPMHLHGTDFRIIAEDSHPLAQPRIVNTIDIAPGKTFEIDFIADNPGNWILHCHELHHTENDGIEPGGLMTVIEFDGIKPVEENSNSTKNDMKMNGMIQRIGVFPGADGSVFTYKDAFIAGGMTWRQILM